jgi:hypothetical protein
MHLARLGINVRRWVYILYILRGETDTACMWRCLLREHLNCKWQSYCISRSCSQITNFAHPYVCQFLNDAY